MMEDEQAAETLGAYRAYGNSKLLCGKGHLIFNTGKNF